MKPTLGLIKAVMLACLLVQGQMPSYAQSATAPAPTLLAVNVGMSIAQVQQVFQQAGTVATGTVTIMFADGGTWNVSSPIVVPCGKVPINIIGPPNNPATATFSSSIVQSMFRLSPCSTPVTIMYLHFNGNRPAAGGGGAIWIPQGTNNVTIMYTQFEGNQGNVQYGHPYDSFIWLDGGQSPAATNIVITHDEFGKKGDCGKLFPLFHYQGANFDAVGGYCAAVGVHTATTNLVIAFNKVNWQEQCFKFYEGDWHPGKQWFQNNLMFNNNHCGHFHRIGVEAQQTPVSAQVINNDFMDQENPGYGSWLISWPEGGPTTLAGNLLIASTPSGAGGFYIPGGVEFWGTGAQGIKNYIQGLMGHGFLWGSPGGGGGAIRNNQMCGPTMNAGRSFIANEEGQANPPAQSGNVYSATCTTQVTAAPVFTANPNMLALSSTTPNSTIYYTTDGSTPTFASAVYTAPINAAGLTVNAFAMWGAPNQPQSYPAGYGFAPSPVATVAFAPPAPPAPPVVPPITPTPPVTPIPPVAPITPSTPVVPTVVAAWLGAVNDQNTAAVGGTVQFTAYGNLSDGTKNTAIPNAQVTAWTTSNPTVMTVNSAGLVTALAPGVAYVQANISGFYSSVWTVTVSATAPTYPVNQNLSSGTYIVTVDPVGNVTVTSQTPSPPATTTVTQ